MLRGINKVLIIVNRMRRKRNNCFEIDIRLEIMWVNNIFVNVLYNYVNAEGGESRCVTKYV